MVVFSKIEGIVVLLDGIFSELWGMFFLVFSFSSDTSHLILVPVLKLALEHFLVQKSCNMHEERL
jgi:hypothetical protein